MDRVEAGPVSDPDEVIAELMFADPSAGQPTVYFIRPSEVDWDRVEGRFHRMPMAIRNGRKAVQQPSLDEEGFVFVRHESQVCDFYDDAEIRRVYYPELERLTRDLTGARNVFVFDHTVRGQQGGTRGSVEVELPSDMMHCDLTVQAAEETLAQVVPGAGEGRWVQLNIWRPIAGPLTTLPLAVCDGRSIKPESYVFTPLVRPDFESEFLTLAYDPEQRWSYLPAMTRDEVIVFKNYDSDPAKTPCSVHGAFVDPFSPINAPARESIEVRVFAQL
ncbi:MAG: CmcJ/NvfI family oxidoreductase [Novosphingobium sp.]